MQQGQPQPEFANWSLVPVAISWTSLPLVCVKRIPTGCGYIMQLNYFYC